MLNPQFAHRLVPRASNLAAVGKGERWAVLAQQHDNWANRKLFVIGQPFLPCFELVRDFVFPLRGQMITYS